MDYTIEMITAIAGQVVNVMKDRLTSESESQPIETIETELREVLRQVGIAAQGQYLSLLGRKASQAEPVLAAGNWCINASGKRA